MSLDLEILKEYFGGIKDDKEEVKVPVVPVSKAPTPAPIKAKGATNTMQGYLASAKVWKNMGGKRKAAVVDTQALQLDADALLTTLQQRREGVYAVILTGDSCHRGSTKRDIKRSEGVSEDQVLDSLSCI